MEKIIRKTHIIDVEGKVLGRVATEIANLLRGKAKPSFMLHKDMGDFVTVKNIGKIKFTGKKLEGKMYFRHSGYLGSMKSEKLKDFYARRPTEVLRKAVMGMLPKNRLRAKQIQRLKFEK